MKEIKNISIEKYTYTLPDERIAKYPLEKRDESKLLIYDKGIISENKFHTVYKYLPSKSLVVFNNTKVIRARLEFFKDTGARIEVFCLEPIDPPEYVLAFSQTGFCQWSCIIGNSKKWKEGILIKDVFINNQKVQFTIEKSGTHGEESLVIFRWNNSAISFGDFLESQGNIPIPPYLNREAEDSDLKNYQTLYSKFEGSVAAPTAGLHFTPQVFKEFLNKEISMHEVTLHVGAGTFKPVKSSVIGEHPMHPEHFFIYPETIPTLLKHVDSITAIGTTSVRTLESLYWLGVKLLTKSNKDFQWELNQWDCYELPQEYNLQDALKALQLKLIEADVSYIKATTSIMIVPGYSFRIVNRLITNFHQPKSTLLLLIAAFIGKNWEQVYDYALKNQFRFLSYGDSNLLIP